MRRVAVKLPEAYVKGLDRLVESDVYPNRAEAIRFAVKDLFAEEK